MKNKKGFTLVELLAVVLILGILITTASLAVYNFLKKGTVSYYKSLEEEIKSAAEEYTNTYRGLLPREIDSVTSVPIKELSDNNYIDTIKDENGDDCDGTVYIEKISQENYKYYTNLICSDKYMSPDTFTEEDGKEYSIVLNKEYDDDEILIAQGETFKVPTASVYKNGILVTDSLLPLPPTVDTNTIKTTTYIILFMEQKNNW